MDVRIETIDEITAVRLRHFGPYDTVGPCFTKLMDWVRCQDLIPGRVFSLSYDDPDVCPAESLRSDACVEVDPQRVDAGGFPAGFGLLTVPAGRYAMITHHGPYEGIRQSYVRLLADWLPASGETMDGRPCMELYRSALAAPEDHVTDLCVPLRSPQAPGPALTGRPVRPA